MSRPHFQDLSCPRCGQTKHFHVDVTATAYLDECGASVEGDYYWDDESCITCLGCKVEGIVFEFVKPTAVQS